MTFEPVDILECNLRWLFLKYFNTDLKEQRSLGEGDEPLKSLRVSKFNKENHINYMFNFIVKKLQEELFKAKETIVKTGMENNNMSYYSSFHIKYII